MGGHDPFGWGYHYKSANREERLCVQDNFGPWDRPVCPCGAQRTDILQRQLPAGPLPIGCLLLPQHRCTRGATAARYLRCVAPLDRVNRVPVDGSKYLTRAGVPCACEHLSVLHLWRCCRCQPLVRAREHEG